MNYKVCTKNNTEKEFLPIFFGKKNFFVSEKFCIMVPHHIMLSWFTTSKMKKILKIFFGKSFRNFFVQFLSCNFRWKSIREGFATVNFERKIKAWQAGTDAIHSFFMFFWKNLTTSWNFFFRSVHPGSFIHQSSVTNFFERDISSQHAKSTLWIYFFKNWKKKIFEILFFFLQSHFCYL